MSSIKTFIARLLQTLTPVVLWHCSGPAANYQSDNLYAFKQYATAAQSAHSSSAFTPIPDSVINNYYVVDIGDILGVRVFEKWPGSQESQVQEALVRADGTIMVVPVGKIKVTGLSVLEIEKLLMQQLKDLLTTPMCEVKIIKSESNRVMVYGDFGTPTEQKSYSIDLTHPLRLTELVAQIGGLSATGDPTSIKVLSRNGKVAMVNLDNIVFRNHLEEDLYLKPGDMVYIPTTTFNKIYVLGEVQRPGLVKLERNNSVLDILALAGGPTEKAYLPTVAVVRPAEDGPQYFSVDLKSVVRGGKMSNNLQLLPGDVVYVPDSPLSKAERAIRIVSGLVNTVAPGYFLYKAATGN